MVGMNPKPNQRVINKTWIATIYPDNLRHEVEKPKTKTFGITTNFILYPTMTFTPISNTNPVHSLERSGS